jgi:hypothetical protein
MYTAHNYQFLAFSAAMQGRKAETVDAARKSRAVASDDVLLEMPGLDWAVGELYTGMVRFGLWDEILVEPAPNPKLRGLSAAYLVSRTMALAARGRVSDAAAELAGLQKLLETTEADDAAGLNVAKDVFNLAVLVAEARIADTQGAETEAISILKDAAAAEDRLAYDEPADWFVPVRQILGATLLKAGQGQEAEAVFLADLHRYPANGWSLFGLAQSLRAQGRSDEANLVDDRFTKAWKASDTTITASVFY